eukprot:3778187-Rhodomonas_salina.1
MTKTSNNNSPPSLSTRWTKHPTPTAQASADGALCVWRRRKPAALRPRVGVLQQAAAARRPRRAPSRHGPPHPRGPLLIARAYLRAGCKLGRGVLACDQRACVTSGVVLRPVHPPVHLARGADTCGAGLCELGGAGRDGAQPAGDAALCRRRRRQGPGAPPDTRTKTPRLRGCERPDARSRRLGRCQENPNT